MERKRIGRSTASRTPMAALLEVGVLLAILVGIVLAAHYVADMPSAKTPGQMAPDIDPRG